MFFLVKFIVLVHVLCLETEGYHTYLMMLCCDCILLLEYGLLTVGGAGLYHGVASSAAYRVGRMKAPMWPNSPMLRIVLMDSRLA